MTPDLIQNEYECRVRSAAHARWGWSFMYVPASRIHSARVALVGLNPGGSQLDPENEWEYLGGENAYVDESWRNLPAGQHHLQVQVRALFEALGVEGKDVFAANLVPFRSPSWDVLPDPDGALQFGRRVWSWILEQSPARVFVSLGKQPGRELAKMLEARFEHAVPAGWGVQTIDTYRAADGRLVIALPHLSRFKIFGGGRSAAHNHIRELARQNL